MRKQHLRFLVCPDCQEALSIGHEEQILGDVIETGSLYCPRCKADYPIVCFIPRFVPAQNYADNFGFEWAKHAKTQYDSFTRTNVSETRFFKETRWPSDLHGEVVLEVGSGSGRFTEQAAKTGAMIVSFDYSYAVDSNYQSNGHNDNVLIVQANLYHMPFPKGFFDKVFCLGVLQHTPDVKKSFMTLPQYLKPSGQIVVDVYSKPKGLIQPFFMKYLVRPFTKYLKPQVLYKMIHAYIILMWPFSRWLYTKLSLEKALKVNLWLLIVSYRGIYALDEATLKEWAVLDTFDMLSPMYDSPQTIETVKRWFEEAELVNIDVCYGYNGIEGHGEKPKN